MKKKGTMRLDIGRGGTMEVKAPKDLAEGKKPKTQKGGDLRSK